MKDLISIIIPLYNGSRYIKECLNSVLKSSYNNIEVIIVDDGSIDNSYEICNNLLKTNNKIKLYKKPNEGIAKARMYGLNKANGKYICFADQDDLVYTDSYLNMINNIKKYDSDICISNFEYLKGTEKEKFDFINKNHYIDGKLINDYIINISSACLINLPGKYSWMIWNCMYKKDFIEKYNIEFKKFKNYEDDFLFNFDYMLNCKRISFEKTSVYIWRQHLKSESHQKNYIDNFFDKNQQLIEYVKLELSKFEKFDIEKWNKLSLEKNFVSYIINEANLKNKNSNKKNINNIKKTYNNIILKENLYFETKFNLKNFLKFPEIFTYHCCKKREYSLLLLYR